jgi:hypothetical protein
MVDAPVVDHEGVAHEVGRDRARARQVVIGSRLFSRDMRRTFFSSLASTKGPFFRLRLI